MDANQFWTFIENARLSAGDDVEERGTGLQAQLAPLSATELQLFQNHYDEQIRRSYSWTLWAAAEIMYGWIGASDDSFRYFRDWLISEGRATFEAALRDPDALAERPRFDMAELELYGYVATELFREKGFGELHRDFSTEGGAEPAGNRWTKRDLPTLLPRLWAKYRKKAYAR